MSNKILFVTSEAYPLVKTGGLGDVSASLPIALNSLGDDARILLPAYKSILDKLHLEQYELTTVIEFELEEKQIKLLETKLPNTNVTVYLIDYPGLYYRNGTPYLDEWGNDWNDNAWRFHLLSKTATEMAMDRLGLNWRPDVMHANDWPSGLSCALLNQEEHRPAMVFTIHNLAHRGLFPEQIFHDIGLDVSLWNMHELEFHGQFSFIKGGLVFADRINTVSPTYAQEIQTPQFGFGLNELLSHRQDRLSGILNGIDTDEWDPAQDKNIKAKYDFSTLDKKLANKKAVQKYFELPQQKKNDESVLLLGLVARLADQKGIDLLLHAMPELTQLPIQLAILGSGDHWLEAQLQQWADRFPDKIGLYIGYDETLSHQIEAGCDAFLMPSHFEPCGLNQLYSLRYGSIPIVNKVGGLADTVVHASVENLNKQLATGIVFDYQQQQQLADAVRYCLELYRQQDIWKGMIKTAMAQEFSWQSSAREYQKLYHQAIADCAER